MLASFLAKEGFAVATAATGAEGLALAKSTRHAVVLCDVVLPDVDGLALVEQLREVDHHQLILVMSAYGSLETAIEAIRRGARDYLSKPFQPQELLLKVRRLLEEERLREENLRLQRELSGRWAFARDRRQERGDGARPRPGRAGREPQDDDPHHRRERHRQGAGRARDPPARAAARAGLRRGELRGDPRGAARERAVRPRARRLHRRRRSHKRGLFEEADGGTLFLDEIGELPAVAPGQAAARAPGGGDPPRRRHEDAQGRRAPARRDVEGPRGRGRRRALPRGPLLPPQRR